MPNTVTPSDRILLVGDIHLMDRPPRSATESYVDDLFDLVAWTFDYAAQEGIRTVVWAGDVFHHKQPSRTSHALLLRLVLILRRARKRGIETWIVVGNHDISNDIIDSVHKKQPLGILFESGLAHELDGWHDTLPIFGIPWQQRWLHENTVEDAFLRYRTALGMEETDAPGESSMVEPPEQTLVVTHAPIYPPDQVENVPFETLHAEDVASAMRGRGNVYYGHIHEDHGFFKVGGVIFGNVGALSRGSIHEYNLERDVQVATWSPTEGFENIVVPIAKAAGDVFRIDEVVHQRSENLTRAAFLADIGSRTLEVADRANVIGEIQGMPNLTPKVRDRAIRILEEVVDA